VIGEIAAGLAAAERIAVTERLLRHPKLDATGGSFERLSQNLSQIPREDRGHFFPLLASAMIGARGRPGIELARAVLRRNTDLLSRGTRAECEDLMEALGDRAAVPLPAVEPSPLTVYDICAGNATWGENEGGEEAEEDFLPPEPVQRKPTPGRNDPCWCGSGKKYKNCHMRDDQTGAGAPNNDDAPG